MKLPETFIPEKDLDKTTESLLNGRNKNRVYSDKVILDGISFQQLGLLADLEGKIDHLKVDFDHMAYHYQMSYTPGIRTKGLLQLVQNSHCLSTHMIKLLGEKVEKSFNVATAYNNPDYDNIAYMAHTGCLLIDFPLKSKATVIKDLEKFFSNTSAVSPVSKFSPDMFTFNNLKAYVEYCGLKERDMGCLSLIPESHFLDKSKTYET